MDALGLVIHCMYVHTYVPTSIHKLIHAYVHMYTYVNTDRYIMYKTPICTKHLERYISVQFP
jgi:hypothetical protein